MVGQERAGTCEDERAVGTTKGSGWRTRLSEVTTEKRSDTPFPLPVLLSYTQWERCRRLRRWPV